MNLEYLKEFFDRIFKVATDPPEVVSAVENVLWHIHSRVIKSEHRSHRRKKTLAGIPFVLITKILLIPINILLSFKTLIISLIIGFLGFYIFEVLSVSQALVLSGSAMILLNINIVCAAIFVFVYDVADLITTGKITDYLVDRYLNLSFEKQRVFLDPKRLILINHIFTRTPLEIGTIEENWKNYFTDLLFLFKDKDDLILEETDRYWSQIRSADSAFHSESPLKLMQGRDYIDGNEWSRANVI